MSTFIELRGPAEDAGRSLRDIEPTVRPWIRTPDGLELDTEAS